jgi:endoglucanase
MNKIISNTGTTWQNIWVMSWDTKWGGVFSLLDPIAAGNANVPAVVQQQIHYFDKWQVQYWSHVPHDNTSDTNFIAQTPAGFSYLTTWGSARYNTAAQLEALAYRKNFPSDPQSTLFSDWAMGQMNYLMGDNPAKWSYIVGFGSGFTRPGRSTGAIQNRIYQANYATMTQTNDYSFNAADTSLTASPLITVYDKGQLIYGTEP